MSEPDDDSKSEWYPYEGGATVGQIGPAGGYVLRDEELGDPDEEEDADARLTLEQGRADNPGFFVTATLYSWLFHTHREAGEAAGVTTYEAMKRDLTELVSLMPMEDDRDISGKVSRLNAAIADFEVRYP
jgi:hypothetical protein